MKKFIPYLFIFGEFILVGIIIFMGFKIRQISKEKIKGVSTIRIEKDNIIMDQQNKQLMYFYEPKPNNIEIWTATWLDNEVKNTINSDSLNERIDYPVQKRESTYRIITLGDSFTFGQYVNTADNYSEILEDILNNQLHCKNINRFEVINHGVYGYDIEYEVERFQKRGLKYEPDLVIWLIGEGNFKKKMENVIPESNRLRNIGIKGFDPITNRSKSLAQAVNNIVDTIGLHSIIEHQTDKLFRFNSIYKNRLLLIPYYKINENIRSKLEEFGYSDLSYDFADNLIFELENKMYQFPDRHPNNLGHKLIAEKMFNYLKVKYFPECTLRN